MISDPIYATIYQLIHFFIRKSFTTHTVFAILILSAQQHRKNIMLASYPKTYLLFNADGQYTNERGDQVDLETHLRHVANGGTPDAWNTVETNNVLELHREVVNSGLHLYVVCEDDDYAVVGEHEPE
tara:strand:+ start:97 stop:477 length:381 start_codon:yes stop_codon:yes gene_type:complete